MRFLNAAHGAGRGGASDLPAKNKNWADQSGADRPSSPSHIWAAGPAEGAESLLEKNNNNNTSKKQQPERFLVLCCRAGLCRRLRRRCCCKHGQRKAHPQCLLLKTRCVLSLSVDTVSKTMRSNLRKSNFEFDFYVILGMRNTWPGVLSSLNLRMLDWSFMFDNLDSLVRTSNTSLTGNQTLIWSIQV